MELKEKLDPKHSALLVIDIQNDFCAPDGLLARRGRDTANVEYMVDRLQKFIQVTEAAEVLTLYTQQQYDRTKLNELQKEQYDLDGKLITCDVETDGYRFYRINPPADKVFVKYNYNAFSSPDLLAVLESHDIKTLVITGVDTYYCVETAIRNGFDLGYKIVVPEDLVAGSSKHPELSERTLELVRKTYGVVSTAEEVANIWTS